MARWTSMSRNDFAAAFRAGAKKGRIGWLSYGIQVTAVALALTAVRAVVSARQHHLAPLVARQDLLMSAIMFLLVAFLSGLALRFQSPGRERAWVSTTIACISDLVILLICSPRIG